MQEYLNSLSNLDSLQRGLLGVVGMSLVSLIAILLRCFYVMLTENKFRKFGEGDPQEGATFTREICYRCSRESCLGFLVPHDVWDRVYIANDKQYDVLCLQCFDDLCEEEWEDDIEFYPVSRASFNRWLTETSHEEKAARFKEGMGDMYKRNDD